MFREILNLQCAQIVSFILCNVYIYYLALVLNVKYSDNYLKLCLNCIVINHPEGRQSTPSRYHLLPD